MPKILIIQLLINFISYIICDLNIHIVPHTHMDPGWIKTPEEYYIEELIENIFNTILNELSQDINKTFVINEIYYFKIWYSEISEEDKLKLKKLIKEKRIEFVSGSYIINDEATPLYYNIIDQVRIGHQFLLEEFGVTPKTGWYIDSFGHSAGNAYILTQLGFENLVLGRMHTDFLELMKNEKKIEFFWEPFGKNSNKKILTHVLPLHYGYMLYLADLEMPNGDFKTNINYIVNFLIDFLKEVKKGLKHNNIMFLFGDDFKHKDKNLFLNIGSLIDYFKAHNLDIDIQTKFGIQEKINVFYSTPEKYFASMKNEINLNSLDTYSNIDFYPYRSDCFWTGFFTSRPYLKGYIRASSNIFYTFSQYFSFNRLMDEQIDENIINDLNALREAVGLVQHHDAITGTCMQYVSNDYIDRLRNGIIDLENNFTNYLENKHQIKIVKICYNNYIADDENCFGEFTIHNNSKDKEIKIGIFNPKFSSPSSFGVNNLLINIEIMYSNYEYEIDGIKSDFFCIDKKGIKNEGLFKYKSKCFLNFFYQFKENEEFAFITLKKSSDTIKETKYKNFNDNKNETIKLVENKMNIQNLTLSLKNYEFNLEYFNEDKKINKIAFTYYDGMYYANAGDCKDGAYIFSPYNQHPSEIEIDYSNSFIYQGELGTTIVTRNINASFTIFTIFYEPFFIKIEHIFDSFIQNYFLNRFSSGYSFVFKTNINNLDEDKKPIFFTDTNGLEMMKRIIDKFPFKETGAPWTGGNFYPLTTSISIQDENSNGGNKNKVTIFTDRPQGGTGYTPGSIILILQRISHESDERGLIENLFETQSMAKDNFKTTHFIVFGNNINKIGDETSHNKYMIQKTNLLNFIYNYFNVATLLFKINQINNVKDYEENIKKENDLRTMIYKNIKVAPDIRANYELINGNLVIGEYFRYNNYFFNVENNIEIDDKSYGIISINFDDNTKFKIYCDKKGIYYDKKTKSVNDEIKDKFISPKKQIFSIKMNEFLYIYYYFNQ